MTPLTAPYDTRFGALLQALSLAEDEAALLTSLPNIQYVTGYRGTCAAVIVCANQLVLITDARYFIRSSTQCAYHEILQSPSDMDGFLADTVHAKGVKRLWLEESMSCERWHLLSTRLSASIESRWITPSLSALRTKKDHVELDEIRRSTRISIDAFLAIRQHIRNGVSELDVAAELEYQCRKMGASTQAFPTIVASGGNSALPHHSTSLKMLEAGDSVVIDWGARATYCSDMTRTVFIGTPSKELERIYRTVLEAQLRAIDALKCGVRLLEVDQIARSVIHNAGFGEFFGHGTGHGVGIQIHEAPVLSPRSQEAIAEAGMVVTVEPGIYVPGVGGVRIEDLIIVHDDRLEIVTAPLVKDFESMIL
ncbi:aminopeptidase P family protein [Chrysiogenes arsenatis]|uniref:aminopeptidase P family protein n=1 Tax=Chrysiogenes arsenatis TaxID=309797 RepID=UPI0004225A4B|nr:aminopeptidase P family protein [Chrysiogenes arsenatis]